MALNTLFLFLFLLLPLVYFIRKKIKTGGRNIHLPPGPYKLPIIGNLHQLGELPHQSLYKLAKKYGPVMYIQLGNIPTIVLSSAEAAKEALKINDLNCCSRPSLIGTKRFTHNFLDVAFTPYSDYWREMRKLCVLEVFSAKRVQSFKSVREEEVASMIDSISNLASSGSVVDLTEKLYALTASTIFRIAYGTIFEGNNFGHERVGKVVHEIEALVGSFFAAEYFPYIGWIFDRLSGLHQRLEKTFHQTDQFFQQIIDDHLIPGRRKQEQDDIVDVLLNIIKEQAGFGAAQLSHDNIKAVLLNMFLGGIDTGAITMIWAMTELVKKPKLMKKAQDEIRSCIGNKGKVSESDTDQLQYLKMVVKETFRLHPPAPMLLPRESMSEFEINGYKILPKTIIQVNAWAIGRDPKYWKSPEEFIPERFSDGGIDFKGLNFELLPFGAGRRICPGMHMAMVTIEFALASLLYHFDWKLPSGMKEEDINMDETIGRSLTTSKKTALFLVPIKFSH